MNQNEKREAVRYACDGGVEVRQPGQPGGLWGTLTDICSTGCYVSSFSPFSAGIAVTLSFHIKHNNLDFLAAGNIVTMHPGVGMGIHFTEVADADRAKLDGLIEDLKAAAEAEAV